MRLLPRLLLLGGILLGPAVPAAGQDPSETPPGAVDTTATAPPDTSGGTEADTARVVPADTVAIVDPDTLGADMPDTSAVAAPDTVVTETVVEEVVVEEGAPLPRVSMNVAVDGDRGRVTRLGHIVIELYPADAPLHVAGFLEKVDAGEYEGLAFHRIVPGFIIQGGDPSSRANWRSPRLGYGGDDCSLPPEVHRLNTRGAVAAARKPDEVNPGHETSCYQIYICLADLPGLDRGNHTVFGQVVEGMDVVEKVARVKNAGSEYMNRALQRVYMTDVKREP